jgi:hypothetical protein
MAALLHKSLYPPGYPVTAAVLRTAIKEMHCSTVLFYVFVKAKSVGTQSLYIFLKLL